ncbi:bifunctional (p)ppGpp synthetase/guanosine-3',5'-bis(diphosphate) 3'-pyrophosphohydrolase, partial [candidate division FCPU426 bacterium]|nr:bifunctional (p)ppGpp synthetase/guanosine-3',5'-bis(diphosphate) 3'-pyrophosphohydrolase [candidate division FCPU426 bacterium]
MNWQELREKMAQVFTPQEMGRLDLAYAFSEKCHAGQVRLSGDPYVWHSVQTAAILHELHSDTDAIIAGLLHDCIEDTPATFEQIQEVFGREIADLVEGVTKISTHLFRDSEEQKAENLRKIMLAMIRDIRVLIIKLADRLHNMRTLGYLPVEKQLRLSRETIEIYSPLAHRLGMGRLKNELEDLGFSFLHPEEYRELDEKMKRFESERAESMHQTKAQLEQLLQQAGIAAQVHGRMKHLFSIWNKMRFQQKNLDQIYDLVAFRIVVGELKDCYAALGIVHAHWKPLPGRFKDFIAMTRSNMYQSLHTTIIGPAGEPLEIQIRTEEMHRTAEEGIAAHWSYKSGVSANEKYVSKLSWFRQFLDWQQDLRDSREFMEALKIDLFEDEVFVFTPKGEVKALRRGANPIDFAYAIHSRLGDTLIGCKVNGRLVPLRYELKNGDIVEVLNRSDAKPSRDWLKIIKTTKAKNRIRHYFRQVEREENIKLGRTQLAEELERCGSSFNEMLKKERLLEVAHKLNFKTLDELLLQIGDNNLTARTVAAKLGLEAPASQQPAPAVAAPREGKEKDAVRVHGLSGMVTRFAQCCHPIPGD